MARYELTDETGASILGHGRGRTIAIVSGQGGVVRTKPALNLGILLACRRCSTILRGVGAGLASVAERFLGRTVEYFGHIPTDQHVAQGVRRRTPVTVRYPRYPASVCVDRTSGRVRPPRAQAVARRGVWARVASLFL